MIQKIALMAGFVCAASFASATDYLYLTQAQNHFDINGINNGGPFDAELLTDPSQAGSTPFFTVYCDSLTQEFSPPQIFQVQIQPLDVGANTSLDPWVVTHADAEAAIFGGGLTHEQIISAVQGDIWRLDNQIPDLPVTSADAGTAAFANYLYTAAHTIGTTNVPGIVRFSADGNYANGDGIFGQSQIGPVPEPFTMGLCLSSAGLFVRRKLKNR